jgi:hypothetical protein
MTLKAFAIVAASAVVLVMAAAPADARSRKPVHPACNDPAVAFSWRDFILGTRPIEANGCAPPVYEGGRFIGQDPDPNIRLQLRRDWVNEGYELNGR